MMKKLTAAIPVLAVLLFSGCMPSGSEQVDPTQSLIMYGVVMVAFFAAMYFIAIRPERKRQKEQENMLSTLTIGDTVLTTAGFYGVVIDITDDTVIVEFGNNKNCRIPMQKAAIVQLEHPEGYVPPQGAIPQKEEKKDQK